MPSVTVAVAPGLTFTVPGPLSVPAGIVKTFVMFAIPLTVTVPLMARLVKLAATELLGTISAPPLIAAPVAVELSVVAVKFPLTIHTVPAPDHVSLVDAAKELKVSFAPDEAFHVPPVDVTPP